MQIVGRQQQSMVAKDLAGTAPARAASADLALAVAAFVLLLVVLAVTRVIDADRRRTLWTAGRLSGLSRGRLARVLALEFGLPALVATVIGAVAGILTVLLAGPRLPLFAAGTAVPPLDAAPGWGLALLVTGGMLAVVLLVALACAATEFAHAGRTRGAGEGT